jgi:hypothetical protein
VLSAWIALISSIILQLDIGKFPVVDAIMMTAIWLGLSNVFSNTNITQQLVFTVDAVRANFVNSYKAISPTTRTNIFFFAILALGSYLSFSSVVAIPSLQEPETQDRLKSEELKERLKAVALTPNDFDNKFPKPATDLKYVSRMISGSEQETDGARTTSPTADLVKNAVQLSIRLLVGNWSRTIDQLRSQWANLRDTFNADQSNLIDVATETFDLSNRGRKGVRETQQHFLAIELWYRRWWTQQATQLNQCREAVERYASEAGGLLESIGSFNTLPSHDSSIETAVITEALKRFSKFENDAKSTCAVTPEVYVIPAREDFGGYLGIFGTAARWLLKTESLSLVLITGLLGFGLVGAACSTFIRNVRTRGAGEPLVPNLASVVIRGGSAAVLIFLAVYGGLAVFAGANTNPNPYVVLFACLAAAVFSDDAWTWGAQQFRSRLSAGGGPDIPQEGPRHGGDTAAGRQDAGHSLIIPRVPARSFVQPIPI